MGCRGGRHCFFLDPIGLTQQMAAAYFYFVVSIDSIRNPGASISFFFRLRLINPTCPDECASFLFTVCSE